MKEIFIQKSQDFSKLEGLAGNDYIILKISKDLNNVRIPAISLKKFRGTIHVILEDSKMKANIEILTMGQTTACYFFSDFKKASILFPANHRFNFRYLNIPKSIDVYTEEDFKRALNLASSFPDLHIYLHQDVLLSGKVPSVFNTTFIHGKGHVIYGKKNVIKTISSFQFSSSNLSYEVVDRILRIKDPFDMQCVLKYPKDRILMTMDRDISWKEIMPLDLRSFYGTLIVLGNGRVMDHITLLDNQSNSIGLISNLSIVADLVIADLHVKHINFSDNQKECVGAFLGSREADNAPYHVMPGKTCFRNCTVSNTFFPAASYIGVFAGKVDDFAECYGCNVDHVLGISDYHYFGNQYYYDWNHLSYTKLSSAENKRISLGDDGCKLVRKK